MAASDQPSGWSLAELLPEPVEESLERALARLEQGVCDFEALRPSLTASISPSDFKTALSKLEAVALLKTRVEAYADLSFAEDTQSPRALNLRDRIDQVLTDTGNRCMFFELWFKELSDDIACRLMDESGDLRYFLQSIRRFKPYTLSEAEEKIISSKDVNGIDAMVSLYNMIANSFSFTLEVEGETKTLTRDELVGYYDNPSAEVRRRAYQELFRVYQEHSAVLAQIYIHRARDWHTEAIDMRGYASPIAARNVANDLPEAVVETLLAVCRKNVPLFQRYFKAKRRWLGLDQLRRYDIYAPLAPADKTFEYAEAKRMVLDSYRLFSPDAAALAQRVFDQNHLDAEMRSGKLSGGLCYSALPDLTPWVMINYGGHAHDIATLAHELGHAIHNMLSSSHSILTQQACLPLAETASVFGEMLLKERLLQEEKDPAVRRELLANALDDAYMTVMRQAFFTIFEKEAHDMIAEGRTLEELTEHYLSNLREQFGDAVQVSDEFKWEWISVPHMYDAPFYTYAYSFGLLLVLALYQQYRLEGQAFLPRYLRILSYGGSKAPLEILSEAGLDVTAPVFWQGGFDVLEKMIAELEQLS